MRTLRAALLGLLLLTLLTVPGDAAMSETVIDCTPDPFEVTTSIKVANDVNTARAER